MVDGFNRAQGVWLVRPMAVFPESWGPQGRSQKSLKFECLSNTIPDHEKWAQETQILPNELPNLPLMDHNNEKHQKVKSIEKHSIYFGF